MALREFVDDAGVHWQVWDTRPSAGRVVSVSPTMRDGWLSFEPVGHAETEVVTAQRLRLVPVPTAWEALPEERLRALLAQARPAPKPVDSTTAAPT